jgi:hypothetical protein
MPPKRALVLQLVFIVLVANWCSDMWDDGLHHPLGLNVSVLMMSHSKFVTVGVIVVAVNFTLIFAFEFASRRCVC